MTAGVAIFWGYVLFDKLLFIEMDYKDNVQRWATNTKKAQPIIQQVALYKLRRLDSNERPPGYEPGELPTAPLRVLKKLKNFRFL